MSAVQEESVQDGEQLGISAEEEIFGNKSSNSTAKAGMTGHEQTWMNLENCYGWKLWYRTDFAIRRLSML